MYSLLVLLGVLSAHAISLDSERVFAKGGDECARCLSGRAHFFCKTDNKCCKETSIGGSFSYRMEKVDGDTQCVQLEYEEDEDYNMLGGEPTETLAFECTTTDVAPSFRRSQSTPDVFAVRLAKHCGTTLTAEQEEYILLEDLEGAMETFKTERFDVTLPPTVFVETPSTSGLSGMTPSAPLDNAVLLQKGASASGKNGKNGKERKLERKIRAGKKHSKHSKQPIQQAPAEDETDEASLLIDLSVSAGLLLPKGKLKAEFGGSWNSEFKTEGPDPTTMPSKLAETYKEYLQINDDFAKHPLLMEHATAVGLSDEVAAGWKVGAWTTGVQSVAKLIKSKMFASMEECRIADLQFLEIDPSGVVPYPGNCFPIDVTGGAVAATLPLASSTDHIVAHRVSQRIKDFVSILDSVEMMLNQKAGGSNKGAETLATVFSAVGGTASLFTGGVSAVVGSSLSYATKTAGKWVAKQQKAVADGRMALINLLKALLSWKPDTEELEGGWTWPAGMYTAIEDSDGKSDVYLTVGYAMKRMKAVMDVVDTVAAMETDKISTAQGVLTAVETASLARFRFSTGSTDFIKKITSSYLIIRNSIATATEGSAESTTAEHIGEIAGLIKGAYTPTGITKSWTDSTKKI